MMASGISSPTIRIPYFPFGYAIALACVPVLLILIREFLESIVKVVKK